MPSHPALSPYIRWLLFGLVVLLLGLGFFFFYTPHSEKSPPTDNQTILDRLTSPYPDATPDQKILERLSAPE